MAARLSKPTERRATKQKPELRAMIAEAVADTAEVTRAPCPRASIVPDNEEIESGTAETAAQVGAARSPLELYDVQRRRRDEAELNRPMTKREAQRIIDAIERLPFERDYSAQRVAERVAENTAKAVKHLEWIAGMLLVMTGCIILIALRVLFWI